MRVKLLLLVDMQLHVSELDRLQHCLDKAFKWGFTSVQYNIRELFELADYKLFKRFSQNADHCLYSLLPVERDLCGRTMRSRGHEFQLPHINSTLFKNTYINRCLFNFM